jgi:prephenate dehydratase
MQENFSTKQIKTIHTLGPSGTNCEAAAYEWFERNDCKGKVTLHDTLEQAVSHVRASRNQSNVVLGCIAYPDLHTLMFSNMAWLKLVDCFVMPTFNMVLAGKSVHAPVRVATHPAPQGLAPSDSELLFVNSNAAAALACANDEADSCITTRVAAKNNQLIVKQDFGQIPMGFSIHAIYEF